MYRSLLVRGAMLPVVCYCLNAKPVRADVSPALRTKLAELNERDKDADLNYMVNKLSGWLPEHKVALESLRTNSHMIKELDFLRVLYQPPLPPSAKIRVRNTVLDFINKEDLTDEQINMLMAVLTYYDCLE